MIVKKENKLFKNRFSMHILHERKARRKGTIVKKKKANSTKEKF